MRFKLFVLLAIVSVIAPLVGTSVAQAKTVVSRAPVVVFQAAGNEGGGVLTPGDTFPPAANDHATLKRGTNWVEVNIHTSGLPAGAYTVWWIIFNNPAGCDDGCGEDDVFAGAINPDYPAEVSAFWATGKVVQANGIGNFVDRYTVGDSLGGDGQALFGTGALDPAVAEVHNIIKYHGPASSDPDVLYAQIHMVDGGCESNANAIIDPLFGFGCFDPQAVVHPLP